MNQGLFTYDPATREFSRTTEGARPWVHSDVEAKALLGGTEPAPAAPAMAERSVLPVGAGAPVRERRRRKRGDGLPEAETGGGKWMKIMWGLILLMLVAWLAVIAWQSHIAAPVGGENNEPAFEFDRGNLR